MTKKLQITIPKKVADVHGIRPGAELTFESAGDVIHLRPDCPSGSRRPDISARLRAFDEATARQRERDTELRRAFPEGGEDVDRGWQREDLYDRGLPR